MPLKLAHMMKLWLNLRILNTKTSQAIQLELANYSHILIT